MAHRSRGGRRGGVAQLSLHNAGRRDWEQGTRTSHMVGKRSHCHCGTSMHCWQAGLVNPALAQHGMAGAKHWPTDPPHTKPSMICTILKVAALQRWHPHASPRFTSDADATLQEATLTTPPP